MRELFRTGAALAAICGLLVTQTACSARDVFTVTADSVIIAAQSAANYLASKNTLTPTEKAILTQYVNDAVTATQDSIAEWKSSDTGAQKADKIYGYVSAVVLPDLSALAPGDALLFTAVDVAVKAILSEVAATSASLRATGSVKTHRLSVAQRNHLAELKARARLHRRSELDQVSADADTLETKLAAIRAGLGTVTTGATSK